MLVPGGLSRISFKNSFYGGVRCTIKLLVMNLVLDMDSKISRRGFMKLSSAAAMASAVGLGVRTEKARAFSASIAQLLVIDPATLEYKVFGPCCYYCEDYLIVSHYQPVALCEVVKGAGDTVFGNPVGSILSAGVDNNDYTSMHARIWEIPDWAIDMAMAFQGCKMCGVDSARSEATRSITDSSLCGTATDVLLSKAMSQINNQLPDCFPKLLYTTEADLTWNNGCRDITKASALAGIECSLFSSVFSMMGLETCIGTRWGPLYPRQMATHQDNASIAAGITAYRALHLSRFAIGSLPFDASLAVGKLQQTLPHITVGLGAGSLGLDAMVRMGNVSLSQVYCFIWWVPVVCCKTYDEVMGLCTPSMPCS